MSWAFTLQVAYIFNRWAQWWHPQISWKPEYSEKGKIKLKGLAPALSRKEGKKGGREGEDGKKGGGKEEEVKEGRVRGRGNEKKMAKMKAFS